MKHQITAIKSYSPIASSSPSLAKNTNTQLNGFKQGLAQQQPNDFLTLDLPLLTHPLNK